METTAGNANQRKPHEEGRKKTDCDSSGCYRHYRIEAGICAYTSTHLKYLLLKNNLELLIWSLKLPKRIVLDGDADLGSFPSSPLHTLSWRSELLVSIYYRGVKRLHPEDHSCPNPVDTLYLAHGVI